MRAPHDIEGPGSQTHRQPALHTALTVHRGERLPDTHQPGLALLLEGGGRYSQPKGPDYFSSSWEVRHRTGCWDSDKGWGGQVGDPTKGLSATCITS